MKAMIISAIIVRKSLRQRMILNVTLLRHIEDPHGKIIEMSVSAQIVLDGWVY